MFRTAAQEHASAAEERLTEFHRSLAREHLGAAELRLRELDSSLRQGNRPSSTELHSPRHALAVPPTPGEEVAPARSLRGASPQSGNSAGGEVLRDNMVKLQEIEKKLRKSKTSPTVLTAARSRSAGAASATVATGVLTPRKAEQTEEAQKTDKNSRIEYSMATPRDGSPVAGVPSTPSKSAAKAVSEAAQKLLELQEATPLDSLKEAPSRVDSNATISTPGSEAEAEGAEKAGRRRGRSGHLDDPEPGLRGRSSHLDGSELEPAG